MWRLRRTSVRVWFTDDFYVLDEKNYAIIGQRKKKKFQLGDEVQIRVKKVDLDKRQIDFTLLFKIKKRQYHKSVLANLRQIKF